MAEITFALAASSATSPGYTDPLTLNEAMDSSNANMWREAIDTKVKSLEDMGTFEIVDELPNNCKTVDSKLIFWVKHHNDKSIKHYKACLVAKGCAQRPGFDYNNTFSPVVCLETIWAILSQVPKMGLKIQQMDVKGAYLNGILKEKVYM